MLNGATRGEYRWAFAGSRARPPTSTRPARASAGCCPPLTHQLAETPCPPAAGWPLPWPRRWAACSPPPPAPASTGCQPRSPTPTGVPTTPPSAAALPRRLPSRPNRRPAAGPCGGEIPHPDGLYCDDCLLDYQAEQFEQRFSGSGMRKLTQLTAAGADPHPRRSGGQATRPDDRRPQTGDPGMGARVRQGRRPRHLRARDPPPHRGRAAQPAGQGDGPLAPLLLADQARGEGAAPAALAGVRVCIGEGGAARRLMRGSLRLTGEFLAEQSARWQEQLVSGPRVPCCRACVATGSRPLALDPCPAAGRPARPRDRV